MLTVATKFQATEDAQASEGITFLVACKFLAVIPYAIVALVAVAARTLAYAPSRNHYDGSHLLGLYTRAVISGAKLSLQWHNWCQLKTS